MPLEYHEPRERLSEEIQDQHRAVESLIEELEAVMWYHQRAAVTTNQALKDVLIHNRDEEIEHAMMNLEWLRRSWPEIDENMRTYLFTSAPITEIEEHEGEGGGEAESGDSTDQDATGSLNIGSLKNQKG